MDKIRALRYFRRVSELNSFSAVAKEFDVPASSISRRIKDLEDELGVELVQRSTRHVKTSELGKLYYQRVNEVLQKLDEADELISQQKNAIKGRISISTSASYGENVLWPVLQAFQQAHPDIILDLDFSDKLVNLNLDSVDIAIRTHLGDKDRVLAKKLASTDMALVASPSYLKQLELETGKKRFSPEDIENASLIIYRTSSGIYPWHYFDDQQWHKIPTKAAFQSNSSATLLSATLNHKGLAVLPFWLIKEALETNHLIKVPTHHPVSSHESFSLELFIIYQKAKYQVPKIKACVDFIEQHLS